MHRKFSAAMSINLKDVSTWHTPELVVRKPLLKSAIKLSIANRHRQSASASSMKKLTFVNGIRKQQHRWTFGIKSAFEIMFINISISNQHHKFYLRFQHHNVPRDGAIIAGLQHCGEKKQRRSYFRPWPVWGQFCHHCKQAGDVHSMKTASSSGSGRTCLLRSSQLSTKRELCTFPSGHYRQNDAMKFDHWKNDETGGNVEHKTKPCFGIKI